MKRYFRQCSSDFWRTQTCFAAFRLREIVFRSLYYSYHSNFEYIQNINSENPNKLELQIRQKHAPYHQIHHNSVFLFQSAMKWNGERKVFRKPSSLQNHFNTQIHDNQYINGTSSMSFMYISMCNLIAFMYHQIQSVFWTERNDFLSPHRTYSFSLSFGLSCSLWITFLWFPRQHCIWSREPTAIMENATHTFRILCGLMHNHWTSFSIRMFFLLLNHIRLVFTCTHTFLEHIVIAETEVVRLFGETKTKKEKNSQNFVKHSWNHKNNRQNARGRGE